MKLPRGATGFGIQATNDRPHLTEFTTICHQAARSTGGRLAGITPAGITPNFHTATITYPDHETAVLQHAVLPLVALATPTPPATTTIAFIDDTDLAAAITAISTHQVLTRTDLDKPIRPDQLTDLADDEHHQITHWQPATIGQLLFNYWD